jgi:hypothetical protein
MNDNDDLRQLFHDAISEVRPRGTYDEIRSRTDKLDPIARRWFLPAIAAAVVLGFVIGGAVWLNRDDGSTATPSGQHRGVVKPGLKSDLAIFYVGEGAHGPVLFYETHSLESDDADDTAAQEAASGAANDPDHVSYWPKSVAITSVKLQNDADPTIRIYLSRSAAGRPAGVTPAEAERQVQAIVRSAQVIHATTTKDDQGSFVQHDGPPAEFYVGDQRQDTVLGVTGPRFTGGGDAAQAPVQVTSVVNGETVQAGDLVVKGLAATFEGNVVWELMLGGDAILDSGTTTAAECCVLSPYEFTINNLRPGTYTLVVHDTDESGTGKPVNQDTKEIVVE